MKITSLKNLLISSLCILLCACNALFDKDNTPPPSPLVNFKPEVNVKQVWSNHTNEGVADDYLKLVPAMRNGAIFTASSEGVVSATNKITGKTLWSINTHLEITAGPTTNNDLVFVGSRDGQVTALRQINGAQVWKTNVSSEILATPAANNNVVLIKAMDGRVHALSTQNGHNLWSYQQVEPILILRRSSAPMIYGNDVFIGFANGNLTKLSLDEGSLLWQQLIANPTGTFAIQRMVDIDADPLIFDRKIYAATYQGQIASLDFNTGRILWSHDISSYTGITADTNKVYITDAKSYIWAFDANSGAVLWRQKKLEARNITGPVSVGPYLVVGDSEGYLHWINKQDGHFAARTRVDSSAIIATPVADQNTVYAVTREGNLAAFTI